MVNENFIKKQKKVVKLFLNKIRIVLRYNRLEPNVYKEVQSELVLIIKI